MKLFIQYLKQRRWAYAVGFLFFILFFFSFLLYRLPLEAVVYPYLLCITVGAVLTVLDFQQVKKRHNAIVRIKSFDHIPESSLPYPRSIEEACYQDIISVLAREHNQYRTQTHQSYEDILEYYTVWVHQIKTPIASMGLSLQNEDSPLARKLLADLNRIEQYVQMVLTFLRLNGDSTDYLIKEYDLDGILRQAVKKFSWDFIGRKLSLVYTPVNTTVVTDEKWLSFVIEQVLSNALKYTRSGCITIWQEDKKLCIRDTGIGIAPEDLPRIFEKGYTGFNGRNDKQASGLGLYLCKQICTNLGHSIWAESAPDLGTTVTIDLAQKKLAIE